ncbi:hypothetical protein AHiyo6_34950 [Arthrobacter sp. Hiyo6]|jgi:hypothetical protein|nr:hypothetical protein AHiyo6_34950 [Arthrobacter sp. Hiyo6]
MCYSHNKDFRQDVKKEVGRESGRRSERTPSARSEPREHLDFKFWAFPRRRRESAPQEPVVDRSSEKV